MTTFDIDPGSVGFEAIGDWIPNPSPASDCTLSIDPGGTVGDCLKVTAGGSDPFSAWLSAELPMRPIVATGALAGTYGLVVVQAAYKVPDQEFPPSSTSLFIYGYDGDDVQDSIGYSDPDQAFVYDAWTVLTASLVMASTTTQIKINLNAGGGFLPAGSHILWDENYYNGLTIAPVVSSRQLVRKRQVDR